MIKTTLYKAVDLQSSERMNYSEHAFTCGTNAHYRYIVRIDGVEVDSEDFTFSIY